MKLLPSLCLAASLTFTTAFAGSLGGPAPFQNGSPLSSGTDGTYNASIRGPSLTGVLRFTISAGSQGGNVVTPVGTATLTPVTTTTTGNYSTRGNSWVAWYEGIVYRGITDASITDGSIAGVLDVMQAPAEQQRQPVNQNYGNSTSNTTVNAALTTSTTLNSTVSLITQVEYPRGIPTTLQSGEFSGTLSLKSPNGNIKGTGTFVVITDLGSMDLNNNRIIPQFIAKNVDFSWKGARVSTTAAATPVSP